MLLRCHGILIPCVVALARTWFLSVGRWTGASWCTLSSIGLLLSMPEITHQWSLGPNLWPGRVAAGAKFPVQRASQFSRVLNFFPVPVEEECLADDNRRQGICMNTYECRIQRGQSHGPCALGFGVCCVFTASCGDEVHNNLTYVTSPGFPNLIDRPMNCSVLIRKIDTEVSQLRIDFDHFNIGQPNATTGVCDEDVMVIDNGRTTSLELCGWNSGQHVYVDVSEGNEPVVLNFRLPSGLQSRMWEMRVMQLGFEQRAPVGCLQYFRSPNGTLRTFNYLPNGRYLAAHDYLVCIRQQRNMCGIAYQPCTRDSFRIGAGGAQDAIGNAAADANAGNASAAVSLNGAAADSTNSSDAAVDDVTVEGSGAGSPLEQEMMFGSSTSGSSFPLGRRCRDRILIPCDFEEFITPGNSMAGICNLEHCGNSLCSSRNELDADGNCRVETWTTPFRVRVAFGPGGVNSTVGTLEDNAGACLTYQQLACVA